MVELVDIPAFQADSVGAAPTTCSIKLRLRTANLKGKIPILVS